MSRTLRGISVASLRGLRHLISGRVTHCSGPASTRSNGGVFVLGKGTVTFASTKRFGNIRLRRKGQLTIGNVLRLLSSAVPCRCGVLRCLTARRSCSRICGFVDDFGRGICSRRLDATCSSICMSCGPLLRRVLCKVKRVKDRSSICAVVVPGGRT